MVNNITSVKMPAPIISVEDFPIYLERSMEIYNKLTTLYQLRKVQALDWQAGQIVRQIDSEIDGLEEESGNLFAEFHKLYLLPREQLTPYESMFTDMIVVYAKLQAVIMGLL